MSMTKFLAIIRSLFKKYDPAYAVSMANIALGARSFEEDKIRLASASCYCRMEESPNYFIKIKKHL